MEVNAIGGRSATCKDFRPGFSPLNRAAELDTLTAPTERMVRMVELRFFAGLSIEATAEALGVDVRTVNRDWRPARALL